MRSNIMDTTNKSETPKTYGPYTPVRQAGDTYYVSGQVGVDPDSKTASSHVAEQVDQALKNLGRALDSVGLSYDDVVKTTLYLTNMSTFSEVNETYVRYFTNLRPARTTVGVATLPAVAGGVALVFEVDAVAVRRKS